MYVTLALLSDVLDHLEAKNGFRSDGFTMSVYGAIMVGMTGLGNGIINALLTATGYGLGTLWIANTCFAYNELMDFIGTDSQLTGIVAVGFADESPAKRPRKPLEEIVEYR